MLKHIALLAVTLSTLGAETPKKLASSEEMTAARTDAWGEAALRQPDGPTYEFFRDLLPPLRYANTEFRFCPIVLSAPQAPQKCRFVSNGSGINLLAKKPPMWNEIGRPIKFCVGQTAELFGSDPNRLDGPKYINGHLPVVSVKYRRGDLTYVQEAFAPVEQQYADCGAAMVRFRVSGQGAGRVEARIEPGVAITVKDGVAFDEKHQALFAFGPNWQWHGEDRLMAASIGPRESAELAVFTQPLAAPPPAMTSAAYDRSRDACTRTWQELLARGTQLAIPETVVNDAWRCTLLANFTIADGNRMNYSTGNAYTKLYQGECGDALRSLLLYGHADTARAMLRPLMEFQRQATRFHVAGHKLQLLTFYYWVTRDAESVRANEDLWRRSLELILTSREPDSGLLPKDNYAGDISQQVYSLNSNANCWRALRDMAAMLDDMGRGDEAKRVREQAAVYRKAILAAVEKSERRDTSPPFIPTALLADEPAHDPITATRIGSYYDLIAPYVMGSDIFQGTQREDWLLGYMQNHGGISMGMVRTEPHQGEFSGYQGTAPLYGLRYLLTLLRRDEVGKALVGFYGHLAQGMTRDTCIGGEANRFFHGDPYGRTMYLPPNSTSNATFLLTLRYLLIQDWDLDDDGKPDTLRLMYGVPKSWPRDGANITVSNAPTMFGPLSLDVQSRLAAGQVTVRITVPPRAPAHTSLRIPLPTGWRIAKASIENKNLQLATDGSVDLSGRTGSFVVELAVAHDLGK